MTDPAARQLSVNGGGQSVGDLISLAVSDVTRLVRCELDLAKLELREDAKRLGLAAALLVIAAFAGCLVLVLLCFALAYGLMALGIWAWASFLIVAGACIGLAGFAALVVARKVRRISGLRKTRESVQEGLALLRRDEAAAPTRAETG
ncbi:MAG TPA: phage holin family protein [Streptosporangiaceae bacterium]|nr:phage holin family protein [Streptosporangiaceae bacterium]